MTLKVLREGFFMAFGIKQFFSAAAALLASLFIGLTVCLMNVSAFSGGRSTYYL